MQRNPLPLLLAVIAVVLGFGLLFTGCNRNEASQTATLTEDEISQRLAEREQVLIEREIELNERVEIVEQREDELAEREEAVIMQPEPEPEPVLEPEPRVVLLTLPATTPLELEILDAVSTGTNLIGDPVRAVVARDVLQDGLIAIPAGSRVFGAVEGLVAEKRIGGQALLSIRFDELELLSGETVSIRAFLDTVGANQKKKDAATIGGSAAGGAILGRILSKDDKTKGTVLGAVLGAAVGTAVASKNGNDPVVIEPGTVMAVQLERAIEVAALH